MKLNKTFLTLMVALIAVLELKNEGKNASVFDAHPMTMVIFCVIFAMYGVLLLADELVQQPNENDYGGIMPKAILCSRSLGVVILFLIIIPVLGWSPLVLWFVCIAKVSMFSCSQEETSNDGNDNANDWVLNGALALVELSYKNRIWTHIQLQTP
ncbi:hypothetical protein FNV43_RR26420 [Rhamnella rubrinervis]|uniref:Uncharacterized protein n=1 Tax=Rhamnella rubrinervis TaxID=2594499 RepID=A0A8K0DP97_9ROSA|nr:hypothetical protein FNV43_RR26420 [Rhamnella rubrinervis]